MQPGYAGIITKLKIVLNAQNNPYLNQATLKNSCEIFLSKKSFDHPRHLKSGVPSPHPPPGYFTIFRSFNTLIASGCVRTAMLIP